MPSNLYTSPVSVRDIFSEIYQFTVPAYQRPYSWRTQEAEQMFEDLVDALEHDTDSDGSEPYFFGTLLMVARENRLWEVNATLPNGTAEIPRDLDIVDGQQRIITLTILVAVLRDLALEAATVAKTKKLADDAAALAATLDALVSRPANGRSLARAHVALSERHRVLFETHIRQPGSCRLDAPQGPLSPAERGLLDVRNYFVAACSKYNGEERRRFATFVTTKCLFVLIIARNIDQGHRIFTVLNDRGVDLEIQDIVKAEVISSFRGQDAAKDAERIWDDAAKRILGEADRNDQKSKRFTEFFSHIRTIFGHHRPPVINGIRLVMGELGGQKFLTDVVQPYAAVTHQIINAGHSGSLQSAHINRLLTYLGWQRSADWMPSTMLWLQLNLSDPTRTLTFLKEMDRFAYALRLQCLASNKRTARFQPLIKAITDNPKIDPSELPFALDDRERRHVAMNLSKLHERNAQICKLVLLRLNDEIGGGLQNVDPEKYSVEHILPKNSGADSEWQQLFTPEQREKSVQVLGNLTLVTKSQNERAANMDFAGKKAIYAEVRGGVGPLAITRELIDAAQWGPAELAARSELMLARINTIWQIPPAVGPFDGMED
jgi:Protein of unknown function DUF262/Protein of unknown function (DUF1524)